MRINRIVVLLAAAGAGAVVYQCSRTFSGLTGPGSLLESFRNAEKSVTESASTGSAEEDPAYHAAMLAALTSDISYMPAGTGMLPSLNQVNAKDQTPLFIASGNGAVAVMKALAARGANVNFVDPYGQTALFWAAWDNKPKAAALLLDKGANIEAKDAGGNTALMMAAGNNAKEAVVLLVARGANKSAINNNGKNAAAIAEDKGYHDVTQLLR